tara:strand:- start:1558 stop:8907 length:7350 start_codon:yes stop_codon:yes gene_type:complete
MFEIEDLFEYDLLQEGAFDSLQEFIDWTSGADPETIFGLLKEGSFDSIEEFKKGVNFQRDVDLKKKENTENTPIISQKENTESNTSTPSVEMPGSSDSSDTIVENPNETIVQENIETADVELPGVEDSNQNADQKISAMMEDGNNIFELDEDGNEIQPELEEGETWLEESWLGQAMDWAFDDVPILGVLSADFWGDMYRAIGNGYTKGQSVDDSIALFAKGKNISDEDLAQYLAAVKQSENVAVSDEMKSFQNIYDDNGGGILGFVLGFGANLSIAPELLIDSLASMINPASAAAAGAGAATGAATGAALTAISGPGALFGASAGAFGGAMGGASAALEFGMSYTEFMKDEVKEKGGKFNQEGIREVLNDPEALQRIRNRAATRGLAIGMIDAMTAGVAGKIVTSTGKALAKGTAKKLAAGGKGTVTRAMVNKGIEISAGLGVEIVGGSTGEAAARLLAGQDMDVAEIGLEGFAGAGNAPISLARGVYTTPRYSLNGDLVTKDYILATIGTATPAQIADMTINIKNDADIKKVVTDLKATSQFELDLEALGVPKSPERDAIVKLELEKSKLPDARSEATRQRRSEIDQEINYLMGEASTVTEKVEVTRDGNTFTETLSVSRAEARAELKKIGNDSPTEGDVSTMQSQLMLKLKDSDQQAEKAIAAEQEVETKRFQDSDVILKEETFTITDEDGSRKEVTVKTNLDGSLSTAKVKMFNADGTPIDTDFYSDDVSLADNDIVVRDGTTAEQQVEFIFAPGEEVVEKTSERSGNEINNPKKTAGLTTDQKQKLGIETETTKTNKDVQAEYDQILALKREQEALEQEMDKEPGFLRSVKGMLTDFKGEKSNKKFQETYDRSEKLLQEIRDRQNALYNKKSTPADVLKMQELMDKSTSAFDAYVEGKENFDKIEKPTKEDKAEMTRLEEAYDSLSQSIGNFTESVILRVDSPTKTNKDAVQKSETKSLDVQEQTRDGQGVGEGDVSSKKTAEVDQKSETENSTSKKPKKKVEGFKTKRQKQPGRYKVPGSRSVDIEVDADGGIKAVDRKTGRPLKGKPKPGVQEYILENIIDVNDGTPLNLDESSNLTPEQYVSEVAENSNNVREVSETIDTERQRLNDQTDSEKQSLADPLDIKNIIGQITEEDYARFGDRNNITPQMRRFWFKKKQKNIFGKDTGQDSKIRGLDDQVMELDGYTEANAKEMIQQVIDFITDNPTGKLNVESGKPIGLVDLEIKFEKLTGLKPTKRNINKVLSIDPNREPIVVTKQKNKESNRAASSEPGKFGKKKGPSGKKITGESKSKKIEVDEASALKSQIKLEARAAKESQQAYRKAANKIAKYITDIKSKGKITSRQAKLLLGKVLRSNLTDAKQVEKLNTYLSKILGDASISERLFNAKKKQKQIAINIKKGLIGSENTALVDVLKELGKVDLSSIPLSKLDAFESLMDTYGVKPKRGALDINDIGPDTQIGLDILNNLEETEKVEVVAKEKKVKEYDLAESITEIQTTKANLEAITDKESKSVADLIDDFTREDIESLIIEKEDGTFDYSQLEKLRGVKKNLSKGIVTPTAMNLLVEVFSNRASKEVSVPISKVTLKGIMLNLRNISSSIKTTLTSKSPSGKNILLDKVRSGPAAYIDNAFGNFNSKTIYENTFGKLAKVYEAFTVDTKKEFSKIEAAERFLEYDGKNYLRRKLRVGTTANRIVAKKYKIRLLQLAREHVLNIGKNGEPNPVAPSAKKLADATLKFFKDQDGYENDFKILKKLVDKFTVDGEISLSKLEESLTPGEKKALKVYDDVNAGLASKAKFTSAVLRSNRIDLLNGYSHRVVLTNGKDAIIEVGEKAEVFSKASTKGGTMVERQPGVRPVSFDPSLSAQRGVQETNLDYYMTSTVREVQKTANKVLKNMQENAGVPAVKAAKALQKSLTEIIKITFTETMRDVTIAEEVANGVKRAAYQAILASIPRMGAELASNLAYIKANPKAAFRGFTTYAGLSFLGRKKGADILNALGSTETTKLFDAKSISSRMTDMSNFAQTSPKSQRARSAFMNVIGQLLKLGPKQTVLAIDSVASGMIQAPDKAVSIPMWYGTFSQTFKNETGIDLSKKDMEAIGEGTSKIQNKDGSIKKEYKKAVERSSRKADQMGTMISSSNNPFKSVIKNQSRKVGEASGDVTNIYRTVNKFMASFSLFEYGTVRNAIGALYRSGDMSRTQATAVLSAATIRMTMYPIMYGFFATEFDELFTNAEVEEDESDIEDIIMRQTIGTMLQLMTRRSMGNIPNLLPTYGIEKFNELMLGDFREGDYDPFKHSISFSQFNEDDIAKKGFSATMLKILAGPMGPILNTVERSVALLYRGLNNKTKESREKNMDELTNRMALESLGNIGLIPFYKDVRRVIMKEMFEDGVIERRQTKAKKEREKYLKYLKANEPEEYRFEIRQDEINKKDLESDDDFESDPDDDFNE